MQIPWYKTWFGKEYLELYAHRDQDEAKKQVEFIIQQIPLTKSAHVLDIACGNGRHIIEFAKRGFLCAGNDLSKDLLNVARENAKHENLKIDFYNSDMRDLPCKDQSFDLAISMFTSFGYFETDGEQIDTLKEWYRVLKRDAYLFIDYLDQDFTLANLRASSVEEIENKIVRQSRLIDAGRVVKKIEIADKETGQTKEFAESVKLYDEETLRSMLKTVGFSEIVRYTDKTIDPNRKRLMLSAKKL